MKYDASLVPENDWKEYFLNQNYKVVVDILKRRSQTHKLTFDEIEAYVTSLALIGKIYEAFNLIDNMHQQYNSRIEFYNLKAYLHLLNEDYKQANRLYQASIEHDTENIEAYIFLAFVNIMCNNHIQAENYIGYANCLLDISSDKKKQLIASCIQALIGLEKEGAKIFKNFLSKVDTIITETCMPLEFVISYFIKKRRYNEALLFANKIIAKFPKNPFFCYMVGFLQIKFKNYESAVVHFEDASALGFESFNFLLSWSYSLAKVKKYEEACNKVTRALELSCSPYALSLLGWINYCKGDFEAAEKTYKRGIEMYPADAKLSAKLCRLYLRSLRFKDAITEFFRGMHAEK
jgi:tetratricopeptide (TPR) repeat protein